MELTLSQSVKSRIEERVHSGRYASVEDVLSAAIMALDQQERAGDFSPGELDALLQAGEKSIAVEGTLDGDEALAARRARRARLRS